MTVVIDCNIFITCLTSRSPYHIIYQSLINGLYTLTISAEVMLEYEEIIQQKYGLSTAYAFIALLNELPNVKFVSPSFKWFLINADADDNKYIDCAITGEASYLVTEDKHFNVLKNIPFPNINIISIDVFKEILKVN